MNGSLLKVPKMSTFDLNMGWLVVVVATAAEMGVGQVAELGVVGCERNTGVLQCKIILKQLHSAS